MPVIKWPSDEEAKVAFDAYTLALGKVAHAWNYLHEQLGTLFVVVVKAEDREVALAIWHKPPSDRTQREMLKAALQATKKDRWSNTPNFKEDLHWLLARADSLAEQRNTAIHAPCALFVGSEPDGTGVQMAASYHLGNPRAMKLVGKDLLAEFAWCEAYSETLICFAVALRQAVLYPNVQPYPARPEKPSKTAEA